MQRDDFSVSLQLLYLCPYGLFLFGSYGASNVGLAWVSTWPSCPIYIDCLPSFYMQIAFLKAQLKVMYSFIRVNLVVA